MAQYIKLITLDFKLILNDFYYYLFNFQVSLKDYQNWKARFFKYMTQFNDRRKYLLKKYVYTINHKRIAINYFFFSIWTGI